MHFIGLGEYETEAKKLYTNSIFDIPFLVIETVKSLAMHTNGN